MKKIAIIGAGAAGMTAAYFALQNGAHVTLFEKNKQVGRKICITGKGRCNLTNNTDARTFLENVVHGSKFLSSAIYRFSPQDTMQWFETLGLSLKTERGNRVFPQSERASDVRDCLIRALYVYPNFSLVSHEVKAVEKDEEKFAVVTEKIQLFDAVILATGGISYPLTGSTGDGYLFARKNGHTVTPLTPSLIHVICRDSCCGMAQGLSLKNVRLSLFCRENPKPIFSELGEMLFTDNGVSGPLVLSASCHIQEDKEDYSFSIDFKPALNEEELDVRLLRDFSDNLNRTFKNSLDALLPAAMRPIFVSLSGIDPEKRVHQITKEERRGLVKLFKSFTLSVVKKGPIEEAIITSGGVVCNEVNPRTMESKLCPGLYFAGEILDVDAYTGGFNLQIAFSTGKSAGESASR